VLTLCFVHGMHLNPRYCRFVKSKIINQKAIIDAGVHSTHVQPIRCDFKLGSMERSIHH
jgi:hypothetical protein